MSVRLIAGDAMPTLAVLSADDNGKLYARRRAPGDGTVPRSSALLDERVGGTWSPRLVTPIAWDGVMFLFTDHLGLTADPAFTDNVLFLLLKTIAPSGASRDHVTGADRRRSRTALVGRREPSGSAAGLCPSDHE